MTFVILVLVGVTVVLHMKLIDMLIDHKIWTGLRINHVADVLLALAKNDGDQLKREKDYLDMIKMLGARVKELEDERTARRTGISDAKTMACHSRVES